MSTVLVTEGHEIRKSPRDLGVSEHREYLLCSLDHRLVSLVRNLIDLLLLRLGCRRPLVIVDENSVRRSSPGERAVDVDEVLDLREMRNSSLYVTVEVGVDNDPADAVGKGAFVVGRDSVSREVVVENRPPFADEVGGTGDVAPGSLREAATSEMSASVNHSEYQKMFRKLEGIFE